MIRKTVRVKAEQAPAEGWPYIEDYVKTYDDGVMEDYAEDVDTLLVLDGLFSAVVTAFVVPAYALLQRDNTQTSVELLSHISTQLSSLTVVPPYINSTASPSNAGLNSFQPSAVARWINSLWFLSLILSLTSAVLGILAKQWIREYLKWNSATGAPRDNILVRQIRVEAWEDWHAPALIASIPALLELAIVLFVCGLTIFLWTLDLVVAIVITITVIMFILLIAILTVLPTMFKRCPYRSPTAWAFLVLWRLARRRLFGKVSYRFYVDDAEDKDGVRQGWRSRDLESIRTHTLASSTGDMINASPVVLEELEEEMKGILQPSWYFERGTYTIQVSPHTAESLFEIPASTIDQHLATMTEPDLLFRALSWITAASQDVGLLQQLRQCSNSIRPPNLAYSIDVYPGMLPTKKLGEISNRRLVELAISRSFRHLTLFYTLARACMPRKTDVETIVDTQLKLYNTACDESKRMAASSIGASVLKRFRTMYTVSPEFALRLKKEAAAPVRGVHVELSVPQRRILSYLLMSELKAAITEMLSAEVLDARHDRRFLVLFSRRAAEILCGLREVALNRHSELPIMEFHGIDCLQELSSLYNTIVRHPEKQQFDEAFPGLRSFFLDFMSDYVHFDFDEDNVVKGERPPSISAQIALENEDRPYGQLDAAAWLTLVGKYSLDQPTTTREDYNIFALLASRAFRAWKDEWMLQPQTSTVATLCKKSADFLHRAGAKGWNNGGSYQSLDWLVAADERSFISHSNTAFCELLYKHAPDEFTDLLYAFEKHCHLIDHTRHDLRYMLGRLRPGEGTTGPSHVTRWHSNWWLSPFGDIANASLGEWTALIQHFTFPTPAHTRTWHHLFVWAANEWILKVGQYAVESPLALDRDIQRWMATHFPKVLEAMATGLDFAVEQGWENGGYDNTSFPWLPSIFLAPSLAESQNWSIIWERDKVLFRSHKVYAPIVYLECFAPAALRLLAISLTRTVVHGYFTNASIQDDVYLLRSYLKASPHERKEIVQRRQRGSIRSEEQQPGHASGVALEEPCRRSPRARATPSTGLKSDPSPDEEANLSLFRALPYHDDLDADDNRPRTFSKRVSHVGGYPIRSGSPASYADSAGFATANTSQKDGDHGPALGFDESRKDGNRESDILDTTQPVLNYHWLHDMDERPFVESPVAFSSRRSLDEMDLCVAADDLTAELRLNTHFESALDAVHREDSIQLVNPQTCAVQLSAEDASEVLDGQQVMTAEMSNRGPGDVVVPEARSSLAADDQLGINLTSGPPSVQ